MKILLKIVSLACLLLTLNGCDSSEVDFTPQSISVIENDLTVQIDDEFQLFVVDDNGNDISSDKLLWESSVPDVASVSTTGYVKVKKSGLTKITAVLADDLMIRTSAMIFCPYQTQDFSESNFIVEKKEVGNEHLKGVLEYIWDTSMFIIDADSLDLLDLLPSFFAKDEYMFSYVVDMGYAEDYVIYSLCDWTNGTVSFNSDIDSDAIYEQLSPKLNKILGIDKTKKGKSFDHYLPQLKTVIRDNCTDDRKWYFGKMDENYEYRVVIKADIDYFDTVSYYQDGLIVANIKLIKGLIKKGWDGLKVDAGLYTTETVDIVNVENMYVCVERRLKSSEE